MKILGINAYHGDSSAAMIVDGELVAAVEEERFLRIKHWAGVPLESVRYCLESAGITLAELDVIAINQDSRANLWQKFGFALGARPDLAYIRAKIRTRRERTSIDTLLADALGAPFLGETIAVEHHLAHLSSAFHVSPFEEAVVVSVDGFGDFASAAWGAGKGTHIDLDKKIFFPHSLGIFYQALTQHLGFLQYGDEYKVMGLAPYGKPVYLKQMQQLVLLQSDGGFKLNLNYFRHHKENIAYEWEDGSPVFGEIYAERLCELIGPARDKNETLNQRHFDIAHSVQAMYEEAFFHLLNTVQSEYSLNELALSGGCAMNSVANGKIYRNTRFKKVYIQSAAGDAGGAIGAGIAAFYKKKPGAARTPVMDHAYWGPQYSNEEIDDILKQNRDALDAAGCDVTLMTDDAQLFESTVSEIINGKVIGWFQGRMEWGPRALGNRSILCDPRRVDMKEILNLKIKRRESFRPFAPSILREDVGDWFEEDDDVPFMMKVFQIREDKRSIIPAVTHVDGSGRLQTVNENTNQKYHGLITCFKLHTGVPMLLNTSFNENEPVVCNPQEALDCFLRTSMDVLVLGSWFILRR